MYSKYKGIERSIELIMKVTGNKPYDRHRTIISCPILRLFDIVAIENTDRCSHEFRGLWEIGGDWWRHLKPSTRKRYNYRLKAKYLP